MKKTIFSLLLATVVSLSIPLSASAAQYETFVGCDDLAENPVPSHGCQLGDFPGAYFESDVETEYDVCVEFPSGAFLCAEDQLAEPGFLYVNSITTGAAGDYFVYWFVEDLEIGFWSFHINAPAPPPPPPVISVPPAPAPAVAPAPSAACLKALQHIGKLKSQLKKASSRKAKTRIRGKLKSARVAAKSAC